MSYDPIADKIFRYYEGPEYLPTDPEQLDKLIRFSIYQLVNNPAKAKKILREAEPEKSAEHMIKNLTNKMRRFDLIGLLMHHGPCEATIGLLIEALENPTYHAHVSKVFLAYRASKLTANALVEALFDKDKRKVASEILLCYGPWDPTVNELLDRIGEGDIEYMNLATKILEAYGEKGLHFIELYIKQQKPEPQICDLITGIMDSIKSHKKIPARISD